MSDHTNLDDVPGMGKLLGFFSTRVLRGGPKILLYLATFLALVLVVIRSMPEGLSDIAFGSISSDIAMGFWAWGQNRTRLENENFQYGAGKRLRIVVFGADDVAAPAYERENTGGNGTIGWTEALCHQLHCSDYQSLIPRLDGASHPLISNEMYAFALEQALNQSAILGKKPGYEYAFASEQYPIPKSLPDLSEQITQFLSRPKPKAKDIPTETLWVFSLGAWDIWSLAAIPLEISEPMIADLSQYVFEQVERIYESSLDSNSVAWSGHNRIGRTRSRLAATSGGSNATESDDTAGMFRIMIPKVFDPSLTPGWHSARPMPPGVHSKAEQMKNAARLTDKWNQAISIRLKAWVKLSDPDPIGNSGIVTTMGGMANNLISPSAGQGSSSDPSKTQTAPATSNSAMAVKESLLRDGIPYDLPEYILRAITDRQFRDSEMEDANGVGKVFETKSFFEVWEPCVNESADDDDEELDDEDDDEEDTGPVLFASERLRSNKLPRGAPLIRGRSPKSRNTSSPESEAKDEAASVVTTCTTPDDHLFYTAFTLSQRAIAQIASQAASMVMKNQTVRERLAANKLPA